MNLAFWAKTIADVKPGQLLRMIANELRRRLYANDIFFGLEFDLTDTITVPDEGVQLDVREIRETDVSLLLPVQGQRMKDGELRMRLERLMLLRDSIPTCYVCISPDKRPCGMCWLIFSQSNHLLTRHFRGGIPVLSEDEVLLENIYIREGWRGRHVMAFLTRTLFRIAAQQGATRAYAFVKADNRSSLQGSQRIGWKLRVIKQVTWRLFVRRITYSHDLSRYATLKDDRNLS